MKKHIKNPFFSLILFNSFLTPIFMTSCHKIIKLTNNVKKEFDDAVNSFELIKKPDIDISNVLDTSITTEEKLLEYFLFSKHENIKYEFINAVVNETTNLLDVTFKITSMSDTNLTSDKKVSLEGFKNAKIIFNDAYDNFDLIKKENIDLSTIYSSSITNEEHLLKYFTFESNPDTTYEFISAKANDSNKKEIVVKYRLISNIDETLNKVKILYISGFNEEDQALIDQRKENEKILNKVLQSIKIEDTESHADISAREFVENVNLFDRYFRINRDEISNIDSTANIFVFPYVTYKRDLKNYTNVIFTVNASVEKNNIKVSGKREIVIGGFKSLVTGLDVKPSPSITHPENSVSYKGKLESVIFKEFGENAYRDEINKKFSFEQLKYELMYQLRFWMYQMFSDNFSELDYWIEGGKKAGDHLTAVIEGIVLNDVNNLVYWCQQIGSANAVKDNLKTGQRIKIKVSLLEPQKWRPIGNGFFGHLDGISGFSFAKGCANIDKSKNDKGAYATVLPISSFNVTVDERTTLSQSRWVQFASVMFTVGGTRSKKI